MLLNQTKPIDGELLRMKEEIEGYAKAYLNIAGRWQDHVLTALVNPGFEAPDQRWSRRLG